MPGLIRLAPVFVVLAALAGAAPARAAQPLAGAWKLGGGTTVEFDQTGAGTFTGSLLQNGKPLCPGNVGGVRVRGTGRSYRGTNRYFLAGSCELFGTGTVKITLAADGLSGEYVATPPPAASCCIETLTMTRSAVATESDLPAIVNSILVALQRQYQRYVHASGKKARRGRAQMRSTALAGRRRVAAYRASADERKLKGCAVRAFDAVAKGAKTKVERAGAGMRAVARCLRPYADSLPNDRPGTPAPGKATPGGPVEAGHYEGGNGTGTHAGAFSFDERGGKVGDFSFSTWAPSRCNGGRGDGFSPFSTPQARALSSDGRFSYTIGDASGGITITGVVSGGRASGTLEVDFPPCSTTVSWTAVKR